MPYILGIDIFINNSELEVTSFLGDIITFRVLVNVIIDYCFYLPRS